MAGKLLLIDNDRQALAPLTQLLGANGYACLLAAEGRGALAILESEPIDLLLLAIRLPDTDGISLCRRIREKFLMPIILLIERGDPADKIIGLEVGADDTLVKPFDPQEALARVRSRVRRCQEYNAAPPERRTLTLAHLRIDLDHRQVWFDNRPVVLTAREFDLLLILARNRGRALQRDWLYEQVWGHTAAEGARSLAVHIRRLRSKIETDPDHPRYLRTVRGFGYQLE
jgi:two-component system alkaline phosphatase synthesis response regulator PhoP